MSTQHIRPLSRRRFLGGLTLAGTTGLLGLQSGRVAAEPPPETTRLRLTWRSSSICRAPQYIAEELLSGEGFTKVHYLKVEGEGRQTRSLLASGQADLSMQFVGPSLLEMDAGSPISLVAGVQVGCWELFGTDQVRTIRDLKGKRVAADSPGDSRYTFLASMLAYVGMDPRTDITWVAPPGDPSGTEAKQLFVEGKVDAFLATPPLAQELRGRKIGHVVVNSVLDRPWSQYFCCLVAGNREFVQKHPVATKRALRAILKAADVCANEPERVARLLVDKGYAEHYTYALQALQEIPYGQWREYDSEDTVRFYALRLHEVGMIKSSPQKLIAQGTDWRFLNELKKELKR
jgi:NitT/TauT family transport system substrate-binding protein